MKYFLPLLVFLTNSLCAAQGDITYSFKEGRIQFLSEKTPNGKVVGLLKSLELNTTVESIKINNKNNTLSFLMLVKEKNPICASWTDAQAVTIQLDPKPVKEITLEGNVVVSSGKVTILVPKN